MPKKIHNVALLQEYICGVMDRAAHHTGNVDEIALAVAGAIIWRKDPDDVEVFAREGDMKNVLWVIIGKKRYALSYNHKAETIELRRRSTRGRCLASFDNDTPPKEVKRIFKRL